MEADKENTGCSPKFDHSLRLEADGLADLCDECLALVKANIQLQRFDKNHANNLNVLLVNLLNAQQNHNGWISIDRNKNRYLRRYSTCSHRILIKNIVDTLLSLGLLEQRLGEFKGNITEIRAIGDLASRLESIQEETFSQDLSVLETIHLKDKKKALRDYEETEDTSRWRNNLREINEALQDSWIDIFVTDDEFPHIHKKKGKSSESLEDEEEYEIADLNSKVLRRIFNNGSFEEGGRFYGGWWQSVSSKWRPFITINHSMTVECDYSNLNAEMLYANSGANRPEGDLYIIDELSNVDHRKHAKLAFQIMLNTGSRNNAVNSLIKNSLESEGHYTAEDLVTYLWNKHTGIQEFFFKKQGTRLQRQDSELAAEIMLTALRERGILLLPIHDSFITTHSAVEYLPDLMSEVFERRMGTKCNTDFNLKFEYNPFQITDSSTELEKRSRYYHNKSKWDAKRQGLTDGDPTLPVNDLWPYEIKDDDGSEF